MDTEALNRAIVGRWFTSFWGSSCDLRIVDELAAPDMLLQYSMDNPRRGRVSVKGFMANFREAFPDLHFRRVGALIADRDIVVIRWEGSGTHTGPAFADFNVGPLPEASRRKLEFSGHSAVRLEGSMIAEEAVWSLERRMRQRPIMAGLILGLTASSD
jgi:hypothetical protein